MSFSATLFLSLLSKLTRVTKKLTLKQPVMIFFFCMVTCEGHIHRDSEAAICNNNNNNNKHEGLRGVSTAVKGADWHILLAERISFDHTLVGS